MCPFFEDDDDPKKPRPVRTSKKRAGTDERGEARRDDDQDFQHVRIVRC